MLGSATGTDALSNCLGPGRPGDEKAAVGMTAWPRCRLGLGDDPVCWRREATEQVSAARVDSMI
jgi:hypothetical protein